MKKPKYKNIKVEVDGIKFDSKKEAKRYGYLQLLEVLGEIKDLELQPRFSLIKGVKFTGDARAKPDIRYTADFRYIDVLTNKVIVEDVKSAVTKEKTDYKMRRHMMLAIHGIEVIES